MMPDVNETAGKHSTNSQSLKSIIAVLVSFTATFMALCNIKDGNIVQAMEQAQANLIDRWSLFQAKSIKQSVTSGTLDMMKRIPTGKPELIIDYTRKIAG